MADLGSFGVETDEVVEPDTFTYFGTTVRVSPAFGELDVADFFEAAASIDQGNVATATAALKGVFRSCIVAEDFDAFWSTAKAHRQGIEDLMEIIMVIVEAVAERPTQRPSVSSDGPSRTRATSAAASSSLVIVRSLEEQGRPSIGYMVEEAERAREGSAATG